jgi:hypothetical protein
MFPLINVIQCLVLSQMPFILFLGCDQYLALWQLHVQTGHLLSGMEKYNLESLFMVENQKIG